MADKNIKEGDQGKQDAPVACTPAHVWPVSWQWSGGRPGGTVAETKSHGDISIQSKKGNTIKKNASADNPAVHVSRSGNDVVKRMSELDKEADGDKSKNGDDAATGDKHDREESKADEDKEEEQGEAKKQKTEKKVNGKAAPKEAPKGRGRPKKGESAKAETKDGSKPEKKAAKPKKERPAASTEGIGSRTRSRAKA